MFRIIMTFWDSEEYYLHYRNMYEKSLNIHMKYQSMGWFLRKIIRFKLQILHYSKFRLEKKINLKGMLLLLPKSHGHSFRVVDIGGGAGDNYFSFSRFIGQPIISWQIQDSKKLWARFHRSELLEIGDDHIYSTQESSHANLVLLIGTLHYVLDDFGRYLDGIISSYSPARIAISRSPFSVTSSKVAEQVTVVFDEYGKKIETTVPIVIYSVDFLIDEFKIRNYSLHMKSERWSYELKIKNGFEEHFYQDLMFNKMG